MCALTILLNATDRLFSLVTLGLDSVNSLGRRRTRCWEPGCDGYALHAA
jgi:hypothetical protein